MCQEPERPLDCWAEIRPARILRDPQQEGCHVDRHQRYDLILFPRYALALS